MRMINRTADEIGWWAFNTDDPLADPSHWLYHTRAPFHSEWQGPGDDKTAKFGKPKMQIEIVGGAQATGILTAVVRPVHIHASKGQLFDDDATVVYTGAHLVSLKGDVAAVMALAGYTDPSLKDVSGKVEMNSAAIKMLLSVAVGLLDGMIAFLDKGGQSFLAAKGGVALAKAIVGSLGGSALSQSVDADSIKQALEDVVNEAQARSNRAQILEVVQWFSNALRRSATIVANGGTDLDPEDRSEFLAQMNDHLAGRTSFLKAMADLKHNREWRLLVLPEYVMGLGLHLNMRRIALMVKQEAARLDENDIQDLRDAVKDYKSTLMESQQDFMAMRKNFFVAHPLITPSLVDSFDDPTHVMAIASPDKVLAEKLKPVEGITLEAGLVAKYLKGNRNLLRHAQDQLDTIDADLGNIPLEATPA